MRANDWKWTSGLVVLAVVAVLAAAGCGPSADEQQAAARQAELEALEEAKAALDAVRQELDEARAAMRQAVSEGDGEEGPSLEELEAGVQELEDKVLEEADAFGAKLVKFINDDPPVVGEEPTETQLAAIRMKSDEDMALARGYIEEGGDYSRAIQIYHDTLAVDPGNQKVQSALDRAEAARFMTEERFAEVKKGMSEDEVRDLLGQVFHRNVRPYPDKDVVAWFYPRDEAGNAAGVYFRKKGEDWVVYEVNFSAVKAKAPAAGG